MDTSSDKLAELHTRRLGYGNEKGNLKRETESFLIAAQNNVIRTYHT